MGRQAPTPRIISKALGPKRSVKMSLIDVSCFPLTALLVLYITRWRVFRWALRHTRCSVVESGST